MSPLVRRRWRQFCQNRRAVGAAVLLAVLFVVSLLAEGIANDKPLLVRYQGRFYFPIFTDYTDAFFGGSLPTFADYKDPFTVQHIRENGWMVMPIVPFSYDTVDYELNKPSPAPPDRVHWLGTDDQARDILARLIYGVRVSLLFGLVLTVLSSVLGIFMGALQGYFGGKVDLILQRVLEIWGSLPQLFVLLIVSSLLLPSFGTLLVVMLLFSWTSLVGVVRAEFLRARNFEYVKAARVLGVSDFRIMLRHLLPNALVSAMTYVPFILSGAVVALTALDFLGFGLPPGKPSLGELVRQGKDNLNAPWIGLAAFVVLSVLLSALIFVGEGVRDAFDPRTKRQQISASGRPLTLPPSQDVLNVRHLSVAFDRRPVVRDVSFCVKKGQTVALVGASGSGKSVTALAVMGLTRGAQVTGSIQLNGKELVGLNEKAMQAYRGHKMAYIFQEPMTALNPLHRVGRQVMEVFTLHFGRGSRRQVLTLFRQVGLRGVARIYRAFPHELSGGERQRVMIAMALAGGPDLLIADEPTTALDVTVQQQILMLLRELQQKLNLSILFISHDKAVVHALTDAVYEMKHGRLTPALAGVPPAPPYAGRKPAAPVVLRAEAVCVTYGARQALAPVSFQLKAGQTLGVVGESGAGKTTLAQALLRLVPFKGRVDLPGTPASAFRRTIQLVFQDPFASLNPRMSVGQIVAEGLRVQTSLSAERRREKVKQALQAVGLPPLYAERYPHELSGGERQRVAIARALVLRPKVLILDEPTSALDEQNRRLILNLLTRLQRRYGFAYLLITHDMALIRQMADTVLVLDHGQAVEQGPVRTIFEQPSAPETQKLMQAAFFA